MVVCVSNFVCLFVLNSFAVNGPATWNRLPPALRSPDQAGTEDAPVLDCPAPLRRCHDSGARYKYPDLLTYLLTYGKTAAAIDVKVSEYTGNNSGSCN